MQDKLTKREYIEEGVRATLQANIAEEVTSAANEAADSIDKAYPSRRTESAQIERAHELARCRRHVINAAIAERACRHIVPRLYYQIQGDYPLPLSVGYIPKDSPLSFSPTLLGASLKYWFSHDLYHDFNISTDQSDPIVQAGYDIYSQYAKAVTASQDYRRRHGLPIWMWGKLSSDWFDCNVREHYSESVTSNAKVAASTVFLEGLVHEREAPNVDKKTFVMRRLGRLATTTSVIRPISIPFSSALEDVNMAGIYSEWENDQTSENAECFLKLANKAMSVSGMLRPDRLKVPGHCTADTKFVMPEAFEIPPEVFLKQMGVKGIEEDIGMSHVFFATAIAVAGETIYDNWPHSPQESNRGGSAH